jgi:hypothetical protein
MPTNNLPTGAPAKACILNLPQLDHEDAGGQDRPRWRNALQAKHYLHCSGVLQDLVEAATSIPLDSITARLVYSPGRGSVQLSWLLKSKSPCALDTAAAKIAEIWCDNLLGAHTETIYLEGPECDVFRTHFLDKRSARSDDQIFILDVAMERLAA